VPGHDLVRIGDKAVERGLVPHEVRALHSARIAIVWQRSGLAAEDLVQVGPEAIVAFPDRVAGAAGVVESELAITGSCGFAGGILRQ
jgi:hypothetical protein